LRRFEYIDALRGYAVLGVLLVHTGQYSGFDSGAAFGARGVQLFFVASALTLMLSWHGRGDGAGAFFVRRCFRILPMFWLSIPIYLGFNAELYTPQVFGAAIFMQAARPDWIQAAIVPGGWSVCAEVGFYLIFPVIAAYVTSLSRAVLFCAAWFAIAAIWRGAGPQVGAALFSGGDVGTWSFLLLPSQLPAFAIGVLLFFAIPRWGGGRTVTEVVLVLTLLLLAYLAAFQAHSIAKFSLCFGSIVVCLAHGAGRYLINTAIVYIGRFSFSIYLLHWLGIGPAVQLADGMPMGGARFFVIFTVTVAVTTVLGGLAYYLVERPMIRLGNALIRRSARAPSLPVAAE
jgi:peptidoglycan/LPS O-acetylase OafA/YrhL